VCHKIGSQGEFPQERGPSGRYVRRVARRLDRASTRAYAVVSRIHHPLSGLACEWGVPVHLLCVFVLLTSPSLRAEPSSDARVLVRDAPTARVSVHRRVLLFVVPCVSPSQGPVGSGQWVAAGGARAVGRPARGQCAAPPLGYPGARWTGARGAGGF
jgi:hypothetical protein